MNVIFDIGMYMLVSALIMIGYVWFKSYKHSRSGYDQLSETNDVVDKPQSAKESLAA